MYLAHFFIQKLQDISTIILDLCKNEHEIGVDFEELLPILQNLNNSFSDLKDQLEMLNEAIINNKTNELSIKIKNEKEELYKNLIYYYYFVLTFGIGMYTNVISPPPLD